MNTTRCERPLNDAEMTAMLAGDEDTVAKAHLMSCGECAAELERLQEALRMVAGKAGADKPEIFWAAQRAKISAGLERENAGAVRWNWALAAAAVILLAIVLNWQGVPTRVEKVQRLSEDKDHQLLLEVEEAVQRPVPRALEPAMLLTAELDRAAQKNHRQ